MNRNIKKFLSIVLSIVLVMTALPVTSFAIEDDLDSIIESIICEDVEIIEYTNGYYTNGYNPETGDWDLEYYYYDIPTPNCVITFKDGTVIECDSPWFEYRGDYYGFAYGCDQSAISPWVAGGTNKVSLIVGNYSTEFNVRIIETDIQSMTVTPSRPFYAGLDDMYSAIDYTVNVVYKNGERDSFVYGSYDAISTADLHFQQDVPNEVGMHIVPVLYRGYTADCVIEVQENPYKKLSISSENGLTLYFTKKDGTIVEAKPYDMYNNRGDLSCAFGVLCTDNGNFSTEFCFEPNNSNKNVKIIIGELESNTLEMNNWFKAETFCEEMINPVQESFSIPYNGEITEENIDEIIGMITVYFPISVEDHINYGDMEADMLNGEEIRQAIAYVFGIENVDLSLSKKYDSSTDTVLFFGGGIGRLLPSTIEYVDNTWVFRRYGDLWSLESVWQIVLNDDLKIISIIWCDKEDNHIFGEWGIVGETCTESGLMMRKCLYCDAKEEQLVIDHVDSDDNGYCDNCESLLDPTIDCECNCHKSGISKFFFNFILFFQRLFGMNKECVCGIVHY